MVHVWIDECTPCLKDAQTGEIVQTEVIRVVRKSFLKKYKESLLQTPMPVMPSQIADTKLDLKGLLSYAKSKQISPALLSDKEKALYLR